VRSRRALLKQRKGAVHADHRAGAAIGFFLFVYANLVALEATLALFRFAAWPHAGKR